jgi:hypothetical protein
LASLNVNSIMPCTIRDAPETKQWCGDYPAGIQATARLEYLTKGRGRYARLRLAGLHDADYRTKTFSCSACGSETYFCLVEPTKEFGMHDYRLDEVEKPERHPDAVKRLTEPPPRPVSSHGGELPGRKIDGRR